MATRLPLIEPDTTQRDLAALLPEILPEQGCWSEEQYLWLTDETNRLIEFTDGYIEVLPMPTDFHQTVLMFLYECFVAFLRPKGGKVLVAALRVRTRAGQFREPDLLLLLDAKDVRRENRFWHGADLVLEVVSPEKPERDWVTKRVDYAEAGIPEYWIVDPQKQSVTILTLRDGAYAEHGTFRRGSVATSALLERFEIEVDAVFDVT